MTASLAKVVCVILLGGGPVAAGPASEAWKALYNAAAESLERGEPREAAAQFRQALAISPRQPKVLYGLVVADFASGQTSGALDAAHSLLGVLRANGGDFASAMTMGRLLVQRNQLAEAMEFLKLARQHAPPRIDGRPSPVFFDSLFASLLTRIEKDREAIAHLEQLVASDAGDPAHRYELGLLLIKTARFSRAYDVFLEALPKFAKSFEIRLGYALACYFTGRHEQAESSYRQLIGMRPGAAEPYFALGNFYADTGRDTDAVEAFGQAARLDPGDYLNHYMYGVELFRVQKVTQAVAHLRRAIQINPSHADSHFWLGKVASFQEHPDEALQEFEKAVSLEPRHIGAYYQLALLYQRRGATDKAQEALRIRAGLTRQMHEGIVAERMAP